MPPRSIGYKTEMKRGSRTERSLAIVGVLMWAAWVLLNGLSPFSIVFGSIGVVISIVEYRQWQRRSGMSLRGPR